MRTSPVNTKVVALKVAEGVYLETDGTTTTRYEVLDVEQIQNWGPHLESIRAVTKTENKTTNHGWHAVVEWSADNRNWYPTGGGTALFTAITANGQVIQSVYSTAANFAGPFIRVSLATANTTGTDRESATVSMWLYFTFLS
mgnify:CR=1 FL=1